MATKSRLCLNVVPGGRDPVPLGAIDVYLAPPAHPPFTAGTQVFEEDTALVTSAPAMICDLSEHPVRLMTDAVFQTTYTPGLVLTKGRKRWLAIVYDFEQEPICQEEWIQSAWNGVCQQIRHYGVHSLAVPLLGVTLSNLTLSVLTDSFIDALVNQPLPLRRLWLIVPDPRCVALRKLIIERMS